MFSRREFSKLALAALPASAAFARRVNSKVHGVQIGAQSYSFRDRSLDECIKGMQEIRLGECELFEGHVGPHASREDMRKWRLTVPLDEIRNVRRKFDAAGIQLYAYNYSFRDDFTDDEIKRGFEITKALGVKNITASSTLSVVDRVDREAKQYKIRVGFHGHSNTKDPNEFSSAGSFEKAMAGRSPYINVNLDIGHFTAAGGDPVAFIQKHHARIVTLHIKDRKKDDGPNMPFGQGDTPIKEVLQLLEKKVQDPCQYRIRVPRQRHHRGSEEVF